MFGQYPFQQSSNTNSSSRPKMIQSTDEISANRTYGPEVRPLESRSGLLNNGREISMNIYRNKKSPSTPSNQSNVQRSISEYFKDLKAPSTVPNASKRLREKYDNFYSQPVDIPEKIQFPRFVSKQENKQRLKYAKQMTTSTECQEPPRKIQRELQTTNANNDRANSSSRKSESKKVIHLIGHVENAIAWYEMLKSVDIHIIYNVIGKFINVLEGTQNSERHVFIRGNNGCVLECCYYEVESALPKMTKGQVVACLGHMVGRQKFTLYNLYVLDQTANLDIQRAIFLSQRMVFEHSGNKFI